MGFDRDQIAADLLTLYDSEPETREIAADGTADAINDNYTPDAGADKKVAVDAGATADYLGALASDGVLRAGNTLSYTDGGNHITLGVNADNVDHNSLLNTHNLTTSINHNTITNTHNLTTSINHDSITNTHNLTTDINHGAIANTHNLTSDIDHGSIGGLAGDDHTQYAKLLGRSGSQILYGGTESGNDLTLHSTSHATKGHILLQDKTGIGRAPGSVGWAKLELYGSATSVTGPHIQAVVSTDNYPVYQLLSYNHDSIHFAFDCYFDGAWRSSDVGSNFDIAKYGDKLHILYNSGVAQGAATTMKPGIVLNTAGGVGIGTAAPAYRLDVLASLSGYAIRFRNDGAAAGSHGIESRTGADSGLGTTYQWKVCDGNGTLQGYLQTVDNVFSLNNVSDERIKQDIADTRVDGLATINTITLKEYRFKKHGDDGPLHKCGFIAQNLQPLFSEAVSIADDEEKTLTVNRTALIPVLCKAIQQLSAEVETLKGLRHGA